MPTLSTLNTCHLFLLMFSHMSMPLVLTHVLTYVHGTCTRSCSHTCTWHMYSLMFSHVHGTCTRSCSHTCTWHMYSLMFSHMYMPHVLTHVLTHVHGTCTRSCSHICTCHRQEWLSPRSTRSVDACMACESSLGVRVKFSPHTCVRGMMHA
jgi:hypothetical protein